MMKFPTHAPFSDGQKQQLESVFASLDASQTTWLGGYLSAVQGAVQAPVVEQKLTVLYGTESGNSEELAEQALKSAKQKGFKAKVLNMSDLQPSGLTEVENLLVIVSTWGDGEPPETAESFYNELMDGGIDLSNMKFSVCALGDTGYDQFCQTGKDIDSQLEKLGATRIVDRVDCDVDFEESFQSWSSQVWEKLGNTEPLQVLSSPTIPASVVYNKKNPFPSEVLENQLLSGDHSLKETIHVELSLEGSGLTYEPGDVLAVIARNADDVVASFLSPLSLTGDEEVEVKDIGKKKLSDALVIDFDITDLSRNVARKWQALVNSDELSLLLEDESKEKFSKWMNGRQIVDLLEEFPVENLTAQQLVNVLRKLPPRLYSIASSMKEHPDEVHLTVAAVRYKAHDRERKGVASTFLADKALVGEKVSVYVHPNKNFKLPESNDTPIIMVGPGTGIAPFRSFIEERAVTAAKGESWLFFGDQRYNEDFLYQLEWQEHLKNGNLTKIDIAFSRDQPQKVYVQDKIQEHAQELWAWLEKGAHFYVCGDASRMAKDVHESLLEIVKNHGGKSEEEAEAYLTELKKNKRYQRDVY